MNETDVHPPLWRLSVHNSYGGMQKEEELNPGIAWHSREGTRLNEATQCLLHGNNRMCCPVAASFTQSDSSPACPADEPASQRVREYKGCQLACLALW